MKQRVSLITLGVFNLERARAFYEALGWTTGAEDSCVDDSPGWGGVTLALNLASPAEVDATIEEARAGGVQLS